MADEKKNLTWLWIIGALIIGGLLVFALFPRTVTVEKEVIKTVEVEKIVEVEKLVTEVEEVPLDIKGTYLNSAIDEFFKYIDEEELTECDGQEYDINQIQVSKVYDNWSVDLGKEEYTVDYQIKLKYLDTDTEEKCYLTFSPSVYYEEGEEPVVTL